ncbi:MAG: hypothetical protein U0Q55_07580 [Vicinamibacterales bacterium]
MRVLALALACAVLSACSSPAPSTAFRTTATVKDIMDSIVDPSSDAIWDSVEIIATLDGVEHKQPRTDDDWKALRREAITLVEASNLLLIPGRHVAKPGEKAEDARVDLHPEEVEALIAKDAAAWTTRAHGLHDAAMESLKAIDAKDVNALMNAGETLDASCESCHRNYWYRVPPHAVESGSVRR